MPSGIGDLFLQKRIFATFAKKEMVSSYLTALKS